MHIRIQHSLQAMGASILILLLCGCDLDIFSKKTAAEPGTPQSTQTKQNQTKPIAPEPAAPEPAADPFTLHAGQTPEEVAELIGPSSGTIHVSNRVTRLYSGIILDFCEGKLLEPSGEAMRRAKIRIDERKQQAAAP